MALVGDGMASGGAAKGGEWWRGEGMASGGAAKGGEWWRGEGRRAVARRSEASGGAAKGGEWWRLGWRGELGVEVAVDFRIEAVDLAETG